MLRGIKMIRTSDRFQIGKAGEHLVCAGSGTTLRACMELNRHSYGFEISKEFCRRAKEEMLALPKDNQIKIEDWLRNYETNN